MKTGGKASMEHEKNFLHDIASPLTSLQLNVENAICVLEDAKPNSAAECLKLLLACRKQMERVSGMIHARREKLTEAAKK